MAVVDLCRGDYIGVLDDDDYYEPDFVTRLLAALAPHDRAGIAFCRTTWESRSVRSRPVDTRPAGLIAGAATAMLTDGWTVCPSLMLFRRRMYDDLQRAHPMPDAVAPDVYLNLRAAIAGWGHVLVDAPLAVLGWHPQQSSRTASGYDAAEATWRALVFDDPRLMALRDRQHARTLIVRAFERLRTGDAAGARSDARRAAALSPLAWPRHRRLVDHAARWPRIGRLAARSWARYSPHGRRRRSPPGTIVRP
jgi:hypothetical protein